SLRQAIADARRTTGADVIRFDAALAGTLTLSSGPLRIADDVAIVGPGGGKIAVSGNDASTVFVVSGPFSHVTLSKLDIVHGRAPRGGRLFVVAGQVRLSQVTVADNQAVGADGVGGGIFNLGGRVTIEQSVFSGNV